MTPRRNLARPVFRDSQEPRLAGKLVVETMVRVTEGRLGMFNAPIVRHLAAARKLSSKDLADLVGVHTTSIDRWLGGEVVPGPEAMVELARVLEVDPATLYVVPQSQRTLSYYRIIKGYSLRGLAVEAKIAHSSLNRYELGTARMSAKSKAKLVEALGIDEATLEAAWDRGAQQHERQDDLTLDLSLPVAV